MVDRCVWDNPGSVDELAVSRSARLLSKLLIPKLLSSGALYGGVVVRL